MMNRNMEKLRYDKVLNKAICEKYNIYIHGSASEQYNMYVGKGEKELINKIIEQIFETIGCHPIKLLDYTKEIDCKGNLITSPDDFLLDNGKRLSIRINKNNSFASPRILGQAGYGVLNSYFGDDFGKKVENQDDIKTLFINKIDIIFPKLIEKTFYSDITVFINLMENNIINVVYKDHIIYPQFELSDFEFTCGLSEWRESNTLKYKDVVVADIQLNKYGTFKFRFKIDKLVQLFIK